MKSIVHNVLGTSYTVKLGDRIAIGISEEHMGACKIYAREILIDTEKAECNEEELKVRTEEILAHEIFHAYINEAGIDLEPGVEEQMASFFMKNWRKMNNSILEVLNESGFLDN